MLIHMDEIELNNTESEQILKIAKAISSKTRYRILQLLTKKEYDISRLAEELNQTEANISAQVKQLENAKLINSRYEPGNHGVRKICKTAVSKVSFIIYDPGSE